jgi:tRNA threonylcarbamoyladenosine biosynthesis protein TsaE
VASAQPLSTQELYLPDPAATEAFGHALAHAVQRHFDAVRAQGLQLNVSGDLGTGKTLLVRSLLRGLGVEGPVKSPTFALLEPYTVSSLDFYHFDFYRFADPAEFGSSGFRELFGPGRICAIEWPERAGERLPTADVALALSVDGPGRRASLKALSTLGQACLTSAVEEYAVRTAAS